MTETGACPREGKKGDSSIRLHGKAFGGSQRFLRPRRWCDGAGGGWATSGLDGDEMAIDVVGKPITPRGATRRRLSDANESANFPDGQPASLPLRSQWLGQAILQGMSVFSSVW